MEFLQSAWFEVLGAIIGIWYLYLEYKANKWLWPVGVLMPVFYVVIFFFGKFYADMSIQVYYFFAGIYGWIRWNRAESSESGNPIKHTPIKYVFPLSVIGSLIFVIIAIVLVKFTDSTVPFGDSFTTALSILGMWMLTQKYVEQWWIWFAVNVISCLLYMWKGLYPTAALFVIYSIVSVMGYYKWKRIMMEDS